MPDKPKRHVHGIKTKKHTTETTNDRGYGWQHQKWAKAILRRDPGCVCPGYEGCTHEPHECMYMSEEADHIIPKERGGGNSLDNGQGLCASKGARCHYHKTTAENAERMK